MRTARPGDEGTTTVVIMLTVPEEWADLRVEEIEERIRNQPHLPLFLAKEIKRWAGEEMSLEELQRRMDEVSGGGA